MLKFKSKKGEVAALLTLGLVLVGTLITLGTSLFVSSKKTNLATNSRAAENSCTSDQGTEIFVANSSSISCATSCTNGDGQYTSSTWTENNEYHCCCKGSSGGGGDDGGSSGDDGGSSNATMTCSNDCVTGSSCTCNGEKGTCSSSGDCEVFNICLGDCVTGSSCTCNGEKGTCKSNGNCAIDSDGGSDGGEDPPASSNGVPYPDKACCFCKDDSISVYAKASARVNNDMSTPCTTAKYGTAYGASSWGYCTDEGKNYEGETCGGGGGGEDPAATGGCKDDKLTCDSGNIFSYSYSTAGACASANTRDTNKCYGTQSNCNKYTYDGFYASKCGKSKTTTTTTDPTCTAKDMTCNTGSRAGSTFTYSQSISGECAGTIGLNSSKCFGTKSDCTQYTWNEYYNQTCGVSSEKAAEECTPKSMVCNTGSNTGDTFAYYQSTVGECAGTIGLNSSKCFGTKSNCTQYTWNEYYNQTCDVSSGGLGVAVAGVTQDSCTATRIAGIDYQINPYDQNGGCYFYLFNNCPGFTDNTPYCFSMPR